MQPLVDFHRPAEQSPGFLAAGVNLMAVTAQALEAPAQVVLQAQVLGMCRGEPLEELHLLDGAVARPRRVRPRSESTEPSTSRLSARSRRYGSTSGCSAASRAKTCRACSAIGRAAVRVWTATVIQARRI